MPGGIRRTHSPSFKAKVALAVVRQCRLLYLSRSTAYYRPRGESEENLAVMKQYRQVLHEASHQGLDNRTPDDVFCERKPLAEAA